MEPAVARILRNQQMWVNTKCIQLEREIQQKTQERQDHLKDLKEINRALEEGKLNA